MPIFAAFLPLIGQLPEYLRLPLWKRELRWRRHQRKLLTVPPVPPIGRAPIDVNAGTSSAVKFLEG